MHSHMHTRIHTHTRTYTHVHTHIYTLHILWSYVYKMVCQLRVGLAALTLEIGFDGDGEVCRSPEDLQSLAVVDLMELAAIHLQDLNTRTQTQRLTQT